MSASITHASVISTNVSNGTVSLTVAFYSNLDRSQFTSWIWDFGDGNTSTATNPINTYFSIDTFTASLTVTLPPDPNGNVQTFSYISNPIYAYEPVILHPVAIQLNDPNDLSRWNMSVECLDVSLGEETLSADCL